MGVRKSVLQIAGKNDEATNIAVYRRILAALHGGRLRPGQRMPEPAIARALGVSRERVRRALHRLAHEGWLELVPNRGACVPAPDAEALAKIFEARLLLEVAAVRLLAERATPAMLERLEAHLAAEAAAARSGDRSQQITLSGIFHERLFEQLDNPWVLGFFRQVVTPTVMAYALHAPQPLPDCGGPTQHRAIVDAIRAGDAEAAERLSREHLDGSRLLIQLLRTRDDEAALEASIEEVFAPLGPIHDLSD